MSTVHTVHLDSHDFGLADECPRCEEHAQHPLDSLDNANLKALLQRIADYEEPRSEAEGVAMANLKRAMDHACAVIQANPNAFTIYAGAKWGLRVIAA